jgi:hypothetical protein
MKNWTICAYLRFGLSVVLAAGAMLCGDASAVGQGSVKTSPDVVIYRGTYPAWPWIAKTPGGKLLCVWREGTEHVYSAAGEVLFSQSQDEGKTWSAARAIVDTPQVDDRNTAIMALSDTHWMLCYNTYTSNALSLAMTSHTVDAGLTWSASQPVSSLDARTRAAPILLSSGALILPYYEVKPDPGSLAALSNDKGETWATVRVPDAPDLLADEWSIAEMPNRSLVGIIRNDKPGNDRSLYVTRSTDGGTSWSIPQKTNLRDGQAACTGSPAQLFLCNGKPWVLYDDMRMVSVALATTDDPNLIVWKIDKRLPAYRYRADQKPIEDGGYPSSISLSNNRRLIVDYLIDGGVRSIVGYYVVLKDQEQ